MPTALIVGASRGIGHEFARQLLAARWQVFATARNDEAVDSLQSEGAAVIRLDVTRPDMLAALGWQLDGVELDLAVYVAGIYGPRGGAHEPPTVSDFDAVMHANVLGAMQLIPLVAPMVEAARGKLVFISSGMASISNAQSSSGWVYRASKAALNMAVKSAVSDYPQATIAAIDPGWVRTDMGGPNATQSVEQSVSNMRSVVDRLRASDSGAFFDRAGHTVPW